MDSYCTYFLPLIENALSIRRAFVGIMYLLKSKCVTVHNYSPKNITERYSADRSNTLLDPIGHFCFLPLHYSFWAFIRLDTTRIIYCGFFLILCERRYTLPFSTLETFRITRYADRPEIVALIRLQSLYSSNPCHRSYCSACVNSLEKSLLIIFNLSYRRHTSYDEPILNHVQIQTIKSIPNVMMIAALIPYDVL